MAVQAQHAVNMVNLPENHGNRARPPQYHRVGSEIDHRFLASAVNQNLNSFLGKNAFQIPPAVNMNPAGPNQYHVYNQLAGGCHGYGGQQLDAAALLNGGEKEQFHAGNLMGCNSRKRTREQAEEMQSPWPQQQAPQQQAPQQQPLQLVMNVTQLDTHPGSVVNPQSTGVSTGLRLTFEDDRVRSASPVSTSGRVESAAKTSFVPTLAENFGSHLQQERDEIAQLLKIQGEQLKSFIEEKRQRHARQLVAAAEEGFARKLREKDIEMDKVRRQNQELMDRFTQLNAESHHWQTKFRNTDAMVNILRSNLHQAQQQAQQAHAHAQAHAQAQAQTQAQFPLTRAELQTKEGCGDSEADDCASSYVDDINDAHTRAFNENKELREQRTCRVCRCNDVSMLLLPCRHLCLCQDCEGQLRACPLCRTPKNAGVQVYMS